MYSLHFLYLKKNLVKSRNHANGMFYLNFLFEKHAQSNPTLDNKLHAQLLFFFRQ